MANSKLDVSGWLAGLEKLKSPQLRESLARSMGVAGGKVLRDEAKRWVPNGAESGSITPGLLESAIYLAHSDKSTPAQQIYKVSWNSKKAPHGHLVEFGHWQNYAVVKLPNGDWFTDVTKPLAQPKWVQAKPFLRPAYDVAKSDAMAAMVQRGRERLPELLAGIGTQPEIAE